MITVVMSYPEDSTPYPTRHDYSGHDISIRQYSFIPYGFYILHSLFFSIPCIVVCGGEEEEGRMEKEWEGGTKEGMEGQREGREGGGESRLGLSILQSSWYA